MIKQFRKICLQSILLNCLSCCFLLPVIAAEKSPQKKLRLVQQELQEINRDIKQSNLIKSDEVKNIRTFDYKIANSNRKLQQIVKSKKNTSTEIAQMKTRRGKFTERIEGNKKNLAEMTGALYRLGKEDYLKIILNQRNAGEQSRMRAYYDYFYESFEKRLSRLKNDLNEVDRLNDALTTKLVKYNRLLKTIEDETATLKTERSEKKQYLSRLDRKIKSKKARIQILKSSRKTLKKILKALKKRKHREQMLRLAGMSFAKNKGKLKWPVTGKIRRKYGQPRSNSGLKWRGILISAKMGEKVRAVDGGTVVFADWLSGYGFVLIIDHGKGYMSLYGYNQQLLKPVGEKLLAGDVIAEAGNSGRLGKPGLYFEIRRNGKPVNPGKWMMAKKRNK